MKKLASTFIELTQDACLKAFWRKDALRIFLIQHRIAEKFLQTWSESETKAQVLARLFLTLAKQEHSQIVFTMAKSLTAMKHFPDLERHEDTKDKIPAAKEAVARLKVEVDKISTSIDDENKKQQRRKDAEKRLLEATAAQQSIHALEQGLADLAKKQGTQKAGYEFEIWFYDLAQFFDIESRRPYITNGRQIDGALTIDGTTFLVELKFENGKTQATDIDIFMSKVTRKADNTMGLFLSMAGYTQCAIDSASRDRTPLLLLDYSHIYNLIIPTLMSLGDVIRRIRRHASQTGEAYLPPNKF